MGKQDNIITKMPDIRIKIHIVILLGITNVLLVISYFMLTHFAVKTVQVDGNKHYSAEEIKSMVMTGYLVITPSICP